VEKKPTLAFELVQPEELCKKFVELSEKYAELLAEHNRILADLKYEQGLGHGGIRPKL
jgi:hypothetical protein